MKLFGTDGIRAQAQYFLQDHLAFRIGLALGQLWQGGTILLGQDSRNSSPVIAQQITAGLQAQNCTVWHLGLCPTPAVPYLTYHFPNLCGGIMISASHNPPQDNGIKFFDQNGNKISEAWQQQIEELVDAITNTSTPELSPASDTAHELLEHYQKALQCSVNTDLSGLHIALDLAWGSAVRLSAQVFRNLGAKVTCIHDQPHGDRINVNCGSTHLDKLQRFVIETGADVGFAFDGDADRVLAVDPQGRVVDGDHILFLWGKDLWQQDRLPHHLIVTTVMANLGFERAWQKLGGKFIRTPVGDQYVHSTMLAEGAMLGGEQSGHILCRHYGISGDGLLTAIHFAELIKKHTLPVLLAESFIPYPQILRNVPVADRQKRQYWHNCQPLLSSIKQAETSLGDRGRVLVRASGTEPVIRVMVEAETHALAHHWTDYLTSAIQTHLS